jgi:hypothetical protein
MQIEDEKERKKNHCGESVSKVRSMNPSTPFGKCSVSGRRRIKAALSHSSGLSRLSSTNFLIALTSPRQLATLRQLFFFFFEVEEEEEEVEVGEEVEVEIFFVVLLFAGFVAGEAGVEGDLVEVEEVEVEVEVAGFVADEAVVERDFVEVEEVEVEVEVDVDVEVEGEVEVEVEVAGEVEVEVAGEVVWTQARAVSRDFLGIFFLAFEGEGEVEEVEVELEVCVEVEVEVEVVVVRATSLATL